MAANTFYTEPNRFMIFRQRPTQETTEVAIINVWHNVLVVNELIVIRTVVLLLIMS